MTAVLPARADEQAPAPARTTHATCGLSVRDWRIHALVDPPDHFADWRSVRTACDSRHPIGCPVQVARCGEICARCAAGVGMQHCLRTSGRQIFRSADGWQLLEILPDRP
jgi:hypothetical protein